VDAAQALTLSDALIELGALSVDVTDALAGTENESPLFSEPSPDPAFKSNYLEATFQESSQPVALLMAACGAAGVHPVPPYRIRKIADRDWVQLTQSQFTPLRISSRLWVVPSWHQIPDPDAVNIILDPGLAFGTGTHPTTRLCLAWLDGRPQAPKSLIDYGCGSGIIAIAAAKLGAGRVVGVDIDPQAIMTSRENAARNKVMVDFWDADQAKPAATEVVVANILANPLQVLAPLLAELTLPGGDIALSGILVPQAEQVMAIYERWYTMNPIVEDEGWALLTGTRRNTS
jgi:ribosomal protein L11 methyltransferase